jgi:hypothetical protein
MEALAENVLIYFNRIAGFKLRSIAKSFFALQHWRPSGNKTVRDVLYTLELRS